VDNLKRYSNKLDITFLTENSLKSRFFIEKMSWANNRYRVADVKNIPCFIISDRSELLVTMQENGEERENVEKKKAKTVALWTNYTAFVETLQMLFFKLYETGKTVQEIYVRSTA
jgi:hypothetical protein